MHPQQRERLEFLAHSTTHIHVHVHALYRVYYLSPSSYLDRSITSTPDEMGSSPPLQLPQPPSGMQDHVLSNVISIAINLPHLGSVV